MKGMTIKAALFKLRAFIALIFIFSFFAFTADAFFVIYKFNYLDQTCCN